MSEFVPTESTPEVWPHRFSVAPMMDYTNVHQRHFQRLLTKKAVLYTEMVTANTSKYDNPRFIASFNVDEPVVLQIGGSDIDHMQDAMKMAVDYGYKEININCGCPSDRVAGSGCFGAKLMLDPQLVVKIVQTMSTVSSVPITVKCRIGVDNNDSYDELVEFIHVLSTQANVKHFIVHARKAILNMKLTPNENRTIPPLKYDVVYQLVKDFPQLDFTINGGITTYEDARKHFANGVKGVMVGRSTIDDCYYWRHIDSEFYGCIDPELTRRQILEKYGEYGDAQEKQQEERAVRGELLKPILNLFRCCKGHKIYRRQLEHYGRIEPLFSRALQLAIVGVSDELLDEK